MPESKERTMHVVFSRASDYRIIAANGAWGGLSPSGDVVFDFHVDRRGTPDKMEVHAKEDGSLREDRTPTLPPIVRESQIGVVLTAAVAKAVGEFLIGYANKALEISDDGDDE